MLKLGLALSILLTIPGELIRIPMGPGNGLLMNDIFLPLLIIFWLLKKIAADREFPKTSLFVPLIIFITTAVLSLLNSLRFLPAAETLLSSFYFIRFIGYAFLYVITADLIKSEKDTRRMLYVIISAAVLIAIGGFIQLKIYPDFRPMEDLGWDPHVGRLLGTFFDPNFIGGALAFVSCIVLGIILNSKKKNLFLAVALLLMATAIFYTYSRSSYLALALGIFAIGILRSRKLLLAIIIGVVVLIPLSPRAETRIVDMYESARSILTQTAVTPDITSQHRLASWRRAVEVYKSHPILGAGYNTFKYVQSNEGLIMNIESHASSGSDSSLLTILATTGPLGLLAFLSIYVIILRRTFKTRGRGISLGMFGGTLGLLVHSIFVNSLLFPHITVFFWVMAGLVENSYRKSR